MMALCGCLAKTTIFLIVVSLELDLNVLFLGYLSEGLFGSVYGLQLGIVAATSDVTGTMKERAMSFAFLEATLAIAGALAQVRMTGELRAHLCEKKERKIKRECQSCGKKTERELLISLSYTKLKGRK